MKNSKKVEINWSNMTFGHINYVLAAGPLFASILDPQAAVGVVAYGIFTQTVGLIGEVVKSISITNVEDTPTTREIFEEKSKEALAEAWDVVRRRWSEELPDIPDEDWEELKKNSYSVIFNYNPESGTAYMDDSTKSPSIIQKQIVQLLHERLNQDGAWQDDLLEDIASTITMAFFSELAERVKEDSDLNNHLNMGVLKKRVNAIEKRLEEMCSTSCTINGTELSQEEATKLKEIYEAYKKKSIDILDRLEKIENGTNEIKKAVEESSKVGLETLEAVREIHGSMMKNSERDNGDFNTASSDTTAAVVAIVSDLMRENSIRRLAEGLWINWRTGALARDFRSALAYEPDEARNASGTARNTVGIARNATDIERDTTDSVRNTVDAVRNTADDMDDTTSEVHNNDASSGYICKLKPHQVRLLSILVQAEGGFICWKELDLRMATMYPPTRRPEGNPQNVMSGMERTKNLFADMGDESWYRYSEERIKRSVRELRSISGELESIIEDPDSDTSSDSGCRIALYMRPEKYNEDKCGGEGYHDVNDQNNPMDSDVYGEASDANSTGEYSKEEYGTDEHGIYEYSADANGTDEYGTYEYDVDSYDTFDYNDDNYGGYEDNEDPAAGSSYNGVHGVDASGDDDASIINEYYRLYSDFCQYYYDSVKLADDNGSADDNGATDGHRADDCSNNNHEGPNEDISAVHEIVRMIAEEDIKILDEANNDNDRKRDKYKEAWFRRYYGQACSHFESDTMNAGNDTDAVRGMFGDYKMAQVYQNAYAAIGTSGNLSASNPRERWAESPDMYYYERTAVLLDYVESWFRQATGRDNDNYGRVLVLHGQPGDGKTTFCKKAVYAHCKEGWLSGDKSRVINAYSQNMHNKNAHNKKERLSESVPYATNVVKFSLNPSDSNNEIHLGEKKILALEEGLCFRESKGSSKIHKITLEALKHALVIFDGYDELSSELSIDSQASSFGGFVGKVLSLAKTYHFNAIITSRTMCIREELSGDAVKKVTEVKAASFAPMTIPQQQAMVNRMIALSPEERDKGGLMSYTVKELPKLRKNENLNELMRIPSLFRMIVTLRFKEYDTDTLAELYQKLIYKLFEYKNISDEEKREMVESYERIAARIFLYNDDTCPFFGTDKKNRELLYRFLTKSNDGGQGQVGFLHRSFYQYFLARFIVSSVKNSKPAYPDSRYGSTTYFPHRTKDGERLKEPELVAPDLVDLVTILRQRRITDLDMWKMVMQVAQIDKESIGKEGKHDIQALQGDSDLLEQKHIRNALDWLENEGNEARLMGDIHGVASECFYNNRSVKGLSDLENLTDNPSVKGLSALENATFNLISSLAAMEQGRCQGMEWEEFDRQSIRFGACDGHHGYPNICHLLRSGDFAEIYLAYVNLSGCDLSNARLQRATFTDVFSITGEISKDDKSIKGKGANLSGADFSGANLSGAALTRARLKDARLFDTNLSGADLIDADLDNVNPVEKDDSKTVSRDTGTDFTGAVLVNALLNNANLKGANMSKAWMIGTKLKSTCFVGANLSGATLTNARLKDTVFEGASLLGAEISGINRGEALGLPKMLYHGVVTANENGTIREVDLLKENEIPFGRYPQVRGDKMDESEYHKWKPLMWKVLRREYDKVLLITRDLIDCQKYNKDSVPITWEECSLRRWMNEDFINTTFTDEERDRIAWVCNQNPDNEYYKIEGGNPTWDRVFALSIDEAFIYLEIRNGIMAPVTPYAVNNGSYISDKYMIRGRGTGWWWLRSPGIYSNCAAIVYTDGVIYDIGYSCRYPGASVRPALWLYL